MDALVKGSGGIEVRMSQEEYLKIKGDQHLLAGYMSNDPNYAAQAEVDQSFCEDYVSTWFETEKEKIIKEVIAPACHEANRLYCESLGDHSQPLWADAPDWQKDSCINGVVFHINNPFVSDEQSHINWMRQKEKEGWVYGEEKDVEKKTHPCMLPYDDLPLFQRRKDFIFSGIVATMRYLIGDALFNTDYLHGSNG